MSADPAFPDGRGWGAAAGPAVVRSGAVYTPGRRRHGTDTGDDDVHLGTGNGTPDSYRHQVRFCKAGNGKF